MLRRMIKRIALFVFFIYQFSGFCQGIHFSYLDFAPQSINPGLIGGYAGSYRGTAIYRDQWNDGSGINRTGGYKTFDLGIDLPVINGFRRQDWIGAGISIDSDQRGSSKLKDTYSRMGLSYHFALDKKQMNVVTLGFQLVNISRTIKNQGLFTNEVLKNGKDTELDMQLRGLEMNGTSIRDFNIGLVFTRSTKTNLFKIGLTGSGILSPRIAFKGNYELPFKMIGFASMVSQLNKTISIEPTALFQFAGMSNEFMFNTKVAYKYDKEKQDKIKAGLGLRTGTFAPIFLIGGEIKGINFGFSYEVPLSGYAKAIGYQDAFELGASYIGLFRKTPKPKPLVICPRL